MATMQRSESVALQEGSKSVLALVLSLSPLYLLLQSRSRLGLDHLHLGLIQVVLLLVLKTLLNFIPFGSMNSTDAKVDSSTAQQQTYTTTKIKTKGGKKKRSKKAVVAPAAEPSLYKPSWLDQIVSNFIASTEPRYLKLLPDPPNPTPLPATPLDEWNSLYKDESIQVSVHPKEKTLFAIRAKFPDVPLRKLYETLIDVQKRKVWDGMCADVGEIETIEMGGRRGSCSWIAMKGIAMIKAKDLCVVSVVNRLPEEADGKVRITCSTTSFDHPKCLPKSEYNRMKLGVSGFLIEDFGEGGSQITQLTDLSGLGSWVPSAVLRTVTQTMLPKSLSRMGRTAATFDLSQSRFAIEGDEWLPPILGSADDSKPDPATSVPANGDAAAIEEEDDDEYTDDEDDSDDELAPGTSRELHSLVDQLRSLTTRLSALESGGAGSGSGSKWGGLFGVATMQKGSGRLAVVGGAAGAAIALAALGAWNRRRR